MTQPALSIDQHYAALIARDTRFDGYFFVGVRSTGVYCRPICPARTPKRSNCDFFRNAAAAERARYRPCLRCRPELAPGGARIDASAQLAARAADAIDHGALDAHGLGALATALGSSSRHLRRVVQTSFGVSPLQLALTRRLHAAKQLLTDTHLPVNVVAQAAGFGSLRRMNDAFLQRYGLAPSAMRRWPAEAEASGAGSFRLRLAYRPPLAWGALLDFLTGRGAASVEAAVGARYCRSLRIGAHTGWIAAAPEPGRAVLAVELSCSLLPVLASLRQTLRSAFDLDADPSAIASHLAQDPRLAAVVAAVPGLRIAGAFDAFELGLRAILGQQVTVKAATTLFGRFAAAFGEGIVTPFAGVTRLAPTAAIVANAPLQVVIDLGLTRRRAETILAFAQHCARGRLDWRPLQDASEQRAALERIPGIGPWTANYIALRALRDPDAFPSGDVALIKAMGGGKAKQVDLAAEAWRPWRAYAALYLWQSLKAGG
jgi:AraC family transcriptional regulator of adaptative response / DNA-3-methyladenine glycosylase II